MVSFCDQLFHDLCANGGIRLYWETSRPLVQIRSLPRGSGTLVEWDRGAEDQMRTDPSGSWLASNGMVFPLGLLYTPGGLSRV